MINHDHKNENKQPTTARSLEGQHGDWMEHRMQQTSPYNRKPSKLNVIDINIFFFCTWKPKIPPDARTTHPFPGALGSH